MQFLIRIVRKLFSILVKKPFKAIFCRNMVEFNMGITQKFRQYFQVNDIDFKEKQLIENMDEISCNYIKHTVDLYRRTTNCKPNAKSICIKDKWCDYDKVQIENAKNVKQPFPNDIHIDEFMMANCYGLTDLPKDVFAKIHDGGIIDCGAFVGDTCVLFNHYFPKTPIYAFDPMEKNIAEIDKQIGNGVIKNTTLFHAGVADKTGKGKFIVVADNELMAIAEDENANGKAIMQYDIVTLDDKLGGKKISLIKADTEGLEMLIILGAEKILKKQKPVLAIAMYHTPQDFFDLKSKIAEMNPEYKFMVRRSQVHHPLYELVLIAY